YTGLEYSNSGIQAIRAVFSLWAIAGQLDVPGGIGLAMADSHFPINRSCNVANPDVGRAAARDRFPLYSDYRGESHATGLLDAVLEDRPYPIRGLIIHGASLLTSWPQTPVWREALAGLDFLCCIDRQLTADAAWADVVLPATTMFEIDSYMTYGPVFRLREKVIEPVGEARSDYLIMAELANRLGYGHLYPQTEEEVLRTVLDGSGFTLEQVREAGGMVQVPTTLHEYRKWEKGGLRGDGQPGFDTPSGKFEFASSVLAEYGYEPLPKYTEPTEGPLSRPDLAQTYPLVFNSGARPHTDFRSQHHGIAGLLKDNPEPTVQMNEKDAEKRGIKAGDLVEVRTPRGAVRFRARVDESIVKGAVEVNMGGGGPVGPEAWREGNVNELTDVTNLDEISGFPVYKALLCEVTRVEQGTSVSRAASMKAPPTWKKGLAEPDRERRAGRVYLDNNATTPLASEVRGAMSPWLMDEGFGNPSSIHGLGRSARKAVEDARRKVAALIGALPRRVVFTGGGSEADNLAIKGLAFASGGTRRKVITSAVEHPAVLGACRFLQTMGFDVEYLDVGPDGLVDLDGLRRTLDEKTLLVSIMTANNEVGSIMPVREMADLAHARGALFHTDAVQAVGKVPVDVAGLGVDLLSLSAHKFHGPKGIGALFVGKGVKLEPLVHGGGQEMSLRAGTENVAAIAGLGRAAELARGIVDKADLIEARRDRIEQGLIRLAPGARLNGPREKRLPNTLNMTLPGLRGESLVIALDRKGISISSGSACKSGDPRPSHALLAMGMSEQDAHCSIRVSLSDRTTDDDVDTLLEAVEEVLEEMKNTVRFLPCK
ncbi:MAG: aminotransferase class V-fold PLP-dependent enzyme, partial [Deltaproteobacteria bacterium]|nr:aminotransferase class V-fold PLP-dependent enzyme [Deltaproteobacteria bacterium]